MKMRESERDAGRLADTIGPVTAFVVGAASLPGRLSAGEFLETVEDLAVFAIFRRFLLFLRGSLLFVTVLFVGEIELLHLLLGTALRLPRLLPLLLLRLLLPHHFMFAGAKLQQRLIGFLFSSQGRL